MPMNPRLLVPRATFDADAAAYLRAVEAADGQALETPVKRAVDDFFKGCKADGTFSAIKASCILCGARTLAGALVPLAGDAPTNYNFVDADYNRETGLVGNGSTKSLSTNINAINLPTLSLAVQLSTSASAQGAYIGTINIIANVSSQCVSLGAQHMTFTRGFNSNADPNRIDGAASSVTGLVGASLSGVTQTHRSGGINIVESVAVQSDPNTMFGVLGRQTEANTFGFYSDARLAFYSIGEALDLALLDTRVTALVTAIGAAI
jgi:hypothetical protein